MYAIVEFLNGDSEINREVSIVPLIWVYKNETKCYWPIRTNKVPFSDFVKHLTPFKKSWPTYKIKLLFKTGSYSAAEAKLQNILSDVYDSNDSSRSLTQKQLQCLDSSGSDLEVSEKLNETEELKNRSLRNTPLLPAEASDLDSVILDDNNSPLAKRSKQDNDIASSPSIVSFQSASRSDFENVVLETLARLMENVEQHSIILDELARYSRTTDKLVTPENLPEFPLKNIDSFKQFEAMLESDKTLWEYMVKRLAALGGFSIENLTRRILKYIMNNEVAVLYNWKGRDKISFEKSKVMELIYAATKINYQQKEADDLKVANAVKDWLKYAKLRMYLKKQ